MLAKALVMLLAAALICLVASGCTRAGADPAPEEGETDLFERYDLPSFQELEEQCAPVPKPMEGADNEAATRVVLTEGEYIPEEGEEETGLDEALTNASDASNSSNAASNASNAPDTSDSSNAANANANTNTSNESASAASANASNESNTSNGSAEPAENAEQPGPLPVSPAPDVITTLQCYKRIGVLGFDEDFVHHPETHLTALREKVYERVGSIAADADETVSFDGKLASDLNAFVAKNQGKTVSVTTDNLIVDEPVILGPHTRLVTAKTRLSSADSDRAFEIINSTDVLLEGFTVDDPAFDCPIFVQDSTDFAIRNVEIRDCSGRAIALMGGCSGFEISGSTLSGCGCGALFVNGECSEGLIARNKLTRNQGSSNSAAALVLGSFKPDGPNTTKIVFWEPNQYDITASPHDIVVEDCEMSQNMSQGAYCHAAYSCYFDNVTMVANRKEGMCMDYASFGNYVGHTSVLYNGDRVGLVDGTPEYNKLPGISLDNAAYNVFDSNLIAGNSGTGLKAVRSSWRNIVVGNEIYDNDRGKSRQAHFFGVEWACDLVPDRPGAQGLDFAPCYENITAKNQICGPHSASIFLGAHSWGNGIIDNVVAGGEHDIEWVTDERNVYVEHVNKLDSTVDL